jgi:ubiquinone/menaquinone biosynthesis C-methylase UbiE
MGWRKDQLGCDRNPCGMVAASDELFACRRCNRSIQLEGDIFVDSDSPKLANLLEQIPYDEIQGVSLEASRSLGSGYLKIVRDDLNVSCGPDMRILEVGSGTGLLSLGLLMNGLSNNLIVSDVSSMFLRTNRNKLRAYAEAANLRFDLMRPVHLRCTMDNLPFKSDSFDLILGNSVLHHVYDYEAALSSFRKHLKTGGCAIMSEPVVQGKVLQAFIVKLICEIDKRSETPVISEQGQRTAADLVTVSKKKWWLNEAERKKDTADDKHLFDIKEIMDLGRRLGFSEVRAFHVGSISKRIEEIVSGVLKRMGLDQDNKYSYIIDLIRGVLIDQMEDKFYCHHAILSFRK